MAGDLDMGHARALLPLEGAQQILSATEIVARKLSVREAEKLVARASASAGKPASRSNARAEKPRDLQRIEHELSDLLTASVDIRVKKHTKRGEQGEVAIGFGSLEELNGLLSKLGLAPH
jgi:ParB family chromosome partitioning protein